MMADNFTVTSLKQTCLIRLPDKFTSVETSFLHQLLQQICYGSEPIADRSSNIKVKKILFDLGQTTFIDSAGLVGLCKILLLARETNIDISFLSFSPQVKIVLSLAGLEHVFPIENITNVAVTDVR